MKNDFNLTFASGGEGSCCYLILSEPLLRYRILLRYCMHEIEDDRIHFVSSVWLYETSPRIRYPDKEWIGAGWIRSQRN